MAPGTTRGHRCVIGARISIRTQQPTSSSRVRVGALPVLLLMALAPAMEDVVVLVTLMIVFATICVWTLEIAVAMPTFASMPLPVLTVLVLTLALLTPALEDVAIFLPYLIMIVIATICVWPLEIAATITTIALAAPLRRASRPRIRVAVVSSR